MRVMYKVVTPARESCSQAGLVDLLGKYALTYIKGETVKARSDSMGIFVFEKRKQAERMIIGDPKHPFTDRFRNCKILRVAVHGKGKVPEFITKVWSMGISYETWKGLKLRSVRDFTADIPEGTRCYRSVTVLE